MASENETVADICAKLKDVANGQNVRNDGLVIEIYQEEIWGALDRIEAAHKREVAELKSKMNDVVCENEALRDACETCGAKREREATREKSSQVGNAAKIREALSDACYAMFNFLKTQNGGYEEMAKALDKAKAALAEPPRNCDVGTTEEQYARVREFCKKHKVGLRCVDCPVNGLFPKTVH